MMLFYVCDKCVSYYINIYIVSFKIIDLSDLKLVLRPTKRNS